MANGNQFKLPPGFELDQPASSGLPPGFQLDQASPQKDTEEDLGVIGAILGAPEAALSILSGFVAEPVAGIAGLGPTIFGGDPEAGARTVESVREALTFQPRTQAGQQQLQAAAQAPGIRHLGEAIQTAETASAEAFGEIGGAPGAAAGAAIPAAILEAASFGLGGIGRLRGVKNIKGIPDSVADDLAKQGVEIDDLTDQGVQKIQADTAQKIQQASQDPTITGLSETKVIEPDIDSAVEVIRKGSPEQVADLVKADPEFFRAADELGISSEPLSSFASRNPQFRDIEGALKSVPGSVLLPQQSTFIKEVSRAADDLIQQYGGTLDKAQLGLNFKDDALRTVEDLAQQADDAYGSLRDIIPPGNRFEAPSTVSFLLEKAQEFGGRDKLPAKLGSMLRKLQTRKKTTKGKFVSDPVLGQRRLPDATESTPPTLGQIDLVRREIGQAINRGTGPFKNVEQGLNKALYARLTKDQDAIATISGGSASALSDTAKGLVRQRKQLEDNLVTLLGKDLNQALNVKVSGAIKNLQKGEIDKFNQVMNAIPKAKRSEVALSAMNDVFKGGGVDQAALGPTQFAKWFETIKRSPAAEKALFSALPKESRRAIENLFTVSKGISRALGQTIPTGRINAMFNPDTGFIRKMVGAAAPRAIAIATGSPTASLLTSSTVDFLRQGTDGAKRASDMMSSPQFQNMVRKSVDEGVVEGVQPSKTLTEAEQRIMKTQRFKKWTEALDPASRSLAQASLISYLFGRREDEQ